MNFRPVVSSDHPEILRVLRLNGHLSTEAEDHERQAFLAGPCIAIEYEDHLIGYVQFRPLGSADGDVVVQCFAIDPRLHGTPTYVRALLETENTGRGLGFRRILCFVPPGHETFRAFLVRVGYSPYALEEDGTQWFKKEMAHVR